MPNDGRITPLESMLTMLDSMTSPNYVVIFTIAIVVAYQFRGSYYLTWVVAVASFLVVPLFLQRIPHTLPALKESLLAGIYDLRIRRFGVIEDIWETIRYSITVNGGVDNGEHPTRRRPRTLPELEQPEEDEVVPSQSTIAAKKRTNGKIEPAFLDPNQYPSGWMVFDPKSGEIVPYHKEGFKINGRSHTENGET